MSAGKPVVGPSSFDYVVVVSSFGGIGALAGVLAALPAQFHTPVLVVQHGARDSDGTRLRAILQRYTSLPICVAQDGADCRRDGSVTLVPAAHAMTLTPDRRFAIVETKRGHGGDALMESVALVAGERTIAVVLTGLRNDGSRGVRAVKRQRGRVLAQDPRTAAADEMPMYAIATGCVDFVLPIDKIAPALVSLTMAHGAAEFFKVAMPSWATLAS